MSETSNKTIAKNTAFLYVRMLLILVVTLYVSRVILDTLGVTDYGIYNVVGGVVTMMTFLNGGLSASTSRFLTYELGTGNRSRLKDVFSASLNLHICVALLVFILGETVGLWFFYEKLVIPDDRMDAAFWVYQFSIVTTMVSFIQVPYNATLISHENMSIYAYISVYEALAKLAIAYFIVLSPIDRLVFYGLLLMLNAIAIQTLYWYYASRRYDECMFRLTKDMGLYKTLLGYSGWDVIGNLAIVSQGQGINILLNMFFGPLVNTAQAIAVQLQSAVVMFINNVLAATRPQVIKSFAEQNYDRMFNLTFYAAKFSYMLMLCMVLPICFEIDFILSIWLGDNVPEETALFSILVLIIYQMETYHLASLMSYHAIGKIKVGNIIGGSMMIFALPLAYIFLKLGFPPYSVFIAIFIMNFLQMFFGWYIIHHYVAFSYLKLAKDVYLPTIVITLISVAIPYLISTHMEEGWVRLIVLTISTEVVMMLLICFVGLKKNERERLLAVIKSRLNCK